MFLHQHGRRPASSPPPLKMKPSSSCTASWCRDNRRPKRPVSLVPQGSVYGFYRGRESLASYGSSTIESSVAKESRPRSIQNVPFSARPAKVSGGK
jgi:hypothetical protein